MEAAETKAGHEEKYAGGTSAVPWPQLDGVRPKTSPALDDRRSEDGEGRGGAKSNNKSRAIARKPHDAPCSSYTMTSIVI